MSTKTNPILRAVRAHATAHKSPRWNRVARFGDDRLMSIVGNRASVINAMKAVRAYMRQLEAE